MSMIDSAVRELLNKTRRHIGELSSQAAKSEQGRLEILNSPQYTQEQKDTLDRQIQEQIASLDSFVVEALADLIRFPPQHVGILTKMQEFRQGGGYDKSVFIMTKFPGNKTPVDKELTKVIKTVQKAVNEAGYIPRIASDKNYHEMLWHNVALYLLGCSRGIAIVESKHTKELNPNVAMEWGWMRAMGKKVLFLAEKSFNLQRADWSGLIEDQFLWDKPGQGIKKAVKDFLA